MKYDDLTEICNKINSCPSLKNDSIDCGRDITAKPKTVEIRNNQKILLITRDPSNQANKLSSVTNFENSFFCGKILPILFEDYDINDAKENRDFFNIYREKFWIFSIGLIIKNASPALVKQEDINNPKTNVLLNI